MIDEFSNITCWLANHPHEQKTQTWIKPKNLTLNPGDLGIKIKLNLKLFSDFMTSPPHTQNKGCPRGILESKK